MNRKEAIIAMANGEKVTHPCFSIIDYITIDDQAKIYDNLGAPMYLPEVDGYKIYKPKVKRKIEVWVNVFKSNNHAYLKEEFAIKDYQRLLKLNEGKTPLQLKHELPIAVAVKLEKEIKVEG